MIPIHKVSCQFASSSNPPSNLLSGGRWLTDVPVQRVELRVQLGSQATDHFSVSRIVLRGVQATHVEVRGFRYAVFDENGGEGILLPRRELQSMFAHKERTQSASQGEVSPSPSSSNLTVPIAPITDDSGALLGFHTLVVTLLCLWEPTVKLGCSDIAVFGSKVAPSTGDSVVAAPVMKKPRIEADSPTPSVGFTPLVAAPKHHALETPAGSTHLMPASSPPVASASPSAASPPLTTAGAAVAPTALPLRGCVVCLSGFVNPLRAEIRDKALTLGAKVKNDWDAECTHLVAAMSGTPKVSQALHSGHGDIVVKEWVLHGFLSRTRPDEGMYRLEGTTAPPPPPTFVPTTPATHTHPTPAPPPPPSAPSPAAAGGAKPFRMVM